MNEKTKKVTLNWEEGAKDPALLKDISETETAFQSADAETAGKIDE
jgi:hypothetical protein